MPCPPCSQILDQGLTTLHVPYSYGFAIILLTILVKLLTFPLTKKQARPYGRLTVSCMHRHSRESPGTARRMLCCAVAAKNTIIRVSYIFSQGKPHPIGTVWVQVVSTMAMQKLQPRVKQLQDKYKNDQQEAQLAVANLYREAQVCVLNSGCINLDLLCARQQQTTAVNELTASAVKLSAMKCCWPWMVPVARLPARPRCMASCVSCVSHHSFFLYRLTHWLVACRRWRPFPFLLASTGADTSAVIVGMHRAWRKATICI